MSNYPLFTKRLQQLQLEEKRPQSPNNHDFEYDEPAPTGKHKSNKVTAEQFKELDISHLVDEDDDNFDIAAQVCKYFDDKFGDKDTVALVADTGKFPAISYWLSGDYVRKHENLNGKHVLVYKACKHIPAKQPTVSKSEFEKYVKQVSIKHKHEKCAVIADILGEKFGEGCHYARSTEKSNASYEIAARFSDGYDASFSLESGEYITAWRR
mmetsp:Transcript_47851/g.79381  ORF Transcript_47851/g.79381 Transcript_47851/m.79381 type:complete len:211 (-) Transcript_47851:275-907(-)